MQCVGRAESCDIDAGESMQCVGRAESCDVERGACKVAHPLPSTSPPAQLWVRMQPFITPPPPPSPPPFCPPLSPGSY
eukprot:280663-Chlamydomonas_euryale.AAC.1